MKIVFLCGSLEPGRDGVGDYVHRLVAELRRQGHQVASIALNDYYVVQETALELPTAPAGPGGLRLPASWPAARRFRRARQWVAAFDPAWISLQFVPYAFHHKGLPFLLGQQLRPLITGRQVHVMMHEAWAGEEPGTGLKRWLLSKLQKALINRLLKMIRPAVVHTHLPVYRRRLQALGWRVRPLPLFSNIPVLHLAPDEPMPAVFRIGIFSQADTSEPFIGFLTRLAEHLGQQHQRLEVLLIGGEPSRMQAIQALLEHSAALRQRVRYTGFMAPEQLSEALQTCSLGLTAVPRHSLGKSGSVAAFLAHGIPVAAPYIHSESVAADIGFFDAGLCSAVLLEPHLAHYQAARVAARMAQRTIQVSAIADLFLADVTEPPECLRQI